MFFYKFIFFFQNQSQKTSQPRCLRIPFSDAMPTIACCPYICTPSYEQVAYGYIFDFSCNIWNKKIVNRKLWLITWLLSIPLGKRYNHNWLTLTSALPIMIEIYARDFIFCLLLCSLLLYNDSVKLESFTVHWPDSVVIDNLRQYIYWYVKK